MNEYPAGFMSYVRFNDEHDHGLLTAFRKRLSGEVQVHTGERFHIFQDREDIEWGQQWPRRIMNCLDHGTFLIPIVTPSFFKSDACRDELERFLAREAELGRDDLILPLYYVNCPVLNDASRRKADPLARIISERHYFDWRELRHKALNSPQSAKMMAKLAMRIAAALESRVPVSVPNDRPAAAAAAQSAGKHAGAMAGATGRKAAAPPLSTMLWTATQGRLWPDMAPASASQPTQVAAASTLSDSAEQEQKSVFQI